MIGKSKSVIALIALFSGLGISQAVENRTAAGILASQTERTYIVQLDDNSGDLNRLQSTVATVLGRQVEFDTTYSHALTGASLELTAQEAQILDSVPGLTVGPNVTYAYPQVEVSERVVTDPAELEHANFTQETIHTDYSEYENAGKGIKIGILDTGLFYDQIATSTSSTGYEAFRPLTADELGATSYDQSDIETAKATAGFHGTDAKYVNSKIIYTYDYADDDNNVQPKSGNEHGTHVASLAAGNGLNYQGMAPNSQLAIMKVFSDMEGGATSVSILNALEDAYILGLDVVNLSLGSAFIDYPGYNDYNSEIEYSTIQNLQNHGVIVNVAAGNDGRAELAGIYANYVSADVVETSELGSYALLDSANTIASSTLDKAYHYFWTVDGVSTSQIEPADQVTGVTLAGLVDGSGDSLEYQVVGKLNNNGTPEDYEGVDVRGKVAVIWRGGGVTFEAMAKTAQANGAAALLVINNTSEQMSMSFGSFTPTIPVLLASRGDGVYFNKDNQSGKLVYNSLLEDNSLVGTISEFSTDGLTSDMRLKPDITAPGTQIMGAVNGGYSEMSGTSMATPNLTGAMALLLGEHDESAQSLAEYKNQLMARAMSTADILRDPADASAANNLPVVNGDGQYVDEGGNVVDSAREAADAVDYNYASPKTQGAGQINLHKALNSEVWLDTGYTDGGDGNVTVGEDGNVTSASVSKQLTNKISFGTGVDASSEPLDFSQHIIHAHNEGDEAVTYEVKMYVALPEMMIPLDSTTWSNFTPEAKEIYTAGYTTTYMKSNNLYQVGEILLDKVTVGANSTADIDLGQIDLSEDSSNPVSVYINNYVNAYYPSGTTLEGYITLTPVGTDYSSSQLSVDGQLSVPYIAFYGDYGAADATEPFDFERTDMGSIRTSDLVNGFAKSYVNFENAYADFGSHIYGISGLNDSSATSLTEAGMTVLAQSWIGAAPVSAYGAQKLGYNASYGAYSAGVVAGVEGQSDQLLIQQFVQRDINRATVDLVQLPTSSAAESKVISTSNMRGFPNMDADITASTGSFGTHLMRSLPTQSALEAGYYAPMAGAVVSLRDSSGALLPEGEYELVFHYDLMATDGEGERFQQTKKVRFTIDRSTPEITGFSTDDYGNNMMTFSEEAEYISFSTDQTLNVRLSIAADGSKFVYLQNGYVYKGLIRGTVYNANGTSQSFLIDNRGETPLLLLGDTAKTSLVTLSRTEADGEVQYMINLVNSAGGLDTSFYLHTHSVYLTVDAGLDPETCGFYAVNSRGQHTALRADQYEYDAETGMLKVFNLGSGVMGIGYAL